MDSVTVNWFEIPVLDMNRAVEFYSAVLGFPLATLDGPSGPMNVFPAADDRAAGALTLGETQPGTGGVLVYLYSDDIDATLGRVTRAGGTVVQERTPIGPFGFIASFLDTEGNRISLHNPV